MEADTAERLLRAYYAKRVADASSERRSPAERSAKDRVSAAKEAGTRARGEKPLLSLLVAAAAFSLIFLAVALGPPSPLAAAFASPELEWNPMAEGFSSMWESAREHFANKALKGDSL